MSTITQRLRDGLMQLANSVEGAAISRYEAADRLRGLAAELEAPAADAVPVAVRRLARAVDCDGDGGMYEVADGDYVSHSDHLATVAELQARIKALEAK